MKQLLYVFLLSCLPYLADAQSPYIPLNSDYYHIIDRFEIRQGQWTKGIHSSVKPYNRQAVVELTDSVIANPDYVTSATDRFNLNYLRDDSWEWVVNRDTVAPITGFYRTSPPQPGDSQAPPILNLFYAKKADAYSVQTPDFDLHVNPVVYAGFSQQSLSNGTDADIRPYVNTRGLELRGTIGKKLGFYTFLSDNQAAYPRYIRDYGQVYGVEVAGQGFAPGEGFAKTFKTGGADFISARGYITFNVLKIINVQFGHDRNFIGNGFRSMLLSDNSAPYAFLKLTTNFGPFQYTNLFAELQNTQAVTNSTNNQLIPQKFAVMHHLSVNLGKHVNVGAFESEILSRDRVDLNYLNPIIFYRFVESFRGSADNANLGIDFKANFLNHFQFYSQFMLDEFILKELVNGKGSWTNKFAVQAGLKYIDAFGIPNLDLQGEVNLARPYTYSHLSGQTNYAHYSQPLAHPLGANFVEGIGIAKYQYKKLSATGIFSVMKTGRDIPGHDYGSNILRDYNDRDHETGNFIGQGRNTLITYADLRLSYMIKHNIFIDARYLYRLQDSGYRPDRYTTNLASFALRWNLAYRNWVL